MTAQEKSSKFYYRAYPQHSRTKPKKEDSLYKSNFFLEGVGVFGEHFTLASFYLLSLR